MIRLFPACILFLSCALISCQGVPKDKHSVQKSHGENQKSRRIDNLTVYETESLVIKKLSNHIYQHISFLDTEDFGKVDCNGMLVVNQNKAVVFDTPINDKSSIELIDFVIETLESDLVAIVPTHFHEDCIGGISAFEKHDIPIFASRQTIALLKMNGQNLTPAVTSFDNNFTLPIGNKKVYAQYFGEGHTKDNIIAYFPEGNTIFGGCLIKSSGAGKGYLGDANTLKWPETVGQIKEKYSKVEIVIPGHGKSGGAELFDYTIDLFNME